MGVPMVGVPRFEYGPDFSRVTCWHGAVSRDVPVGVDMSMAGDCGCVFRLGLYDREMAVTLSGTRRFGEGVTHQRLVPVTNAPCKWDHKPHPADTHSRTDFNPLGVRRDRVRDSEVALAKKLVAAAVTTTVARWSHEQEPSPPFLADHCICGHTFGDHSGGASGDCLAAGTFRCSCTEFRPKPLVQQAVEAIGHLTKEQAQAMGLPDTKTGADAVVASALDWWRKHVKGETPEQQLRLPPRKPLTRRHCCECCGTNLPTLWGTANNEYEVHVGWMAIIFPCRPNTASTMESTYVCPTCAPRCIELIREVGKPVQGHTLKRR